MRCFLAVMRKEVRHVLRDPYALAGATLGTALLMVLMTYAISADIEHIPIAVFDGDHSPQSRAYLQRFVNDTFFDVDYWAQSHKEAREWVRLDRVRGAIIVPAGFGAALQRGEQAPVQIIADGTEPIALQITGNAEALSAAVAWLATLLPALSIVRERERGTLEQLFVTPMRSIEFILSKAILAAAITFLGFLEALAVITLHLQVPLKGSLALLVILGMFYIFVEMG